jgi:hypothetical protein
MPTLPKINGGIVHVLNAAMPLLSTSGSIPIIMSGRFILSERHSVNLDSLILKGQFFPGKSVVTPSVMEAGFFKITPALNGIWGNDYYYCLAVHVQSSLLR